MNYKALRRIIEDRGLDQKKVAAMCSFSYCYLNRVCNGKCDMASKNIVELCNVLNCEPNDIVW